MGFSLSGTHVIYFIAAVIIAGIVSGIFIGIINDVSSSLSNRGNRVQEQLDTDFQIINDPNNIPEVDNNYLFYLKNIGGKKLITTNANFQIFIDGNLIPVGNYTFLESSIQPGDVATLYIQKSDVSTGDQTLRIVGPMAIEDEFTFTI
jgi:flagellar protein FlaG